MKKILTSVFAIAVVATVAGIGSWAYWNDTERSTGNMITADKLDLKLSADEGVTWVNDNDLASTGVIPISIGDTYPGDTGTATVMVKNDSNTVDGALSFEVDNIRDDENGLVEPEEDVADTIADGELCDNVKVTVLYNGSATSVTNMPIKSFSSTIPLGTLAAGSTGTLTISYTVDTSAGNEIMTDKCTFDLAADLQQI